MYRVKSSINHDCVDRYLLIFLYVQPHRGKYELQMAVLQFQYSKQKTSIPQIINSKD